MIYDYENWTGTRPELVTVIRMIEQNYPNQYKMYSKQLGKLISINERRIQQFIDEGIVPKPVFENKKYQYNFTHIVRYLSGVILRNKGFPLKIIKEQLDQNDFEFLKNEFIHGKEDKEFLKKENLEDAEFSGRLQKLGRNEGRVLNILQMKLAITPWCNLSLNLNKLNTLKDEDIDTLTEGISRSLKALIKNK
jgi:DNA-binding transcriptional MerR regulator